MNDSSEKKVEPTYSPRAEMGQKYLASEKSVSMRLREETPGDSKPETKREYETVGYVISGNAELHLEGQMVLLRQGDSWVVPKGPPTPTRFSSRSRPSRRPARRSRCTAGTRPPPDRTGAAGGEGVRGRPLLLGGAHASAVRRPMAVIALVPIGDVSPEEIMFLAPILQEAFGLGVVPGPSISVPDDAYDPARRQRLFSIVWSRPSARAGSAFLASPTWTSSCQA